MVERRYANYLRDDGHPPEPEKAQARGPLPSRAWFERAADDEEDPVGAEQVEPEGPWTMTVEHRMEHATNHAGTFADLVDIAERAGVTEYYVWSSRKHDFVLHTRTTVAEPES